MEAIISLHKAIELFFPGCIISRKKEEKEQVNEGDIETVSQLHGNKVCHKKAVYSLQKFFFLNKAMYSTDNILMKWFKNINCIKIVLSILITTNHFYQINFA